jgi:hypothetical protein
VLLLVAHVAATWYLTGVIWLVQLVHYPMMGRTGAAFDDCQRFHLRRMGAVVGPAMIVEAATGLALLWTAERTPVLWTASALLALIWISTFAIQVPCHNRLARTFDPRTHQQLVRTNWLRTIAWTARSLLVTAQILP